MLRMSYLASLTTEQKDEMILAYITAWWHCMRGCWSW